MRNSDLAAVFLIIVVFLAVVGIDRRKQAIDHFVNKVVTAAAAGVLAYIIAAAAGLRDAAAVIALLTAALTWANTKKRSRHIPRRVRRKVITDWETETGKTFNRRIHELDHDIPFSIGGGHAVKNLKVRTKRENRKKGNKSPSWDLFG